MKSPSNWSAVSNRRSLIALTALATASSIFAEQPVAPINADWTQDAPGVRHKITLADLPPPFATKSANNGPRAEWVPGRFARTRAAESPGRVVHSAKSWLCHHGVDRSASFLPWRSDEIPVEKRISPIRASALLLQYLRAAWDARFGAEGQRFDDQEITITVPASFDAAAQRLTLDAAREAGFPEGIRLLEEPQAAFRPVV